MRYATRDHFGEGSILIHRICQVFAGNMSPESITPPEGYRDGTG